MCHDFFLAMEDSKSHLRIDARAAVSQQMESKTTTSPMSVCSTSHLLDSGSTDVKQPHPSHLAEPGSIIQQLEGRIADTWSIHTTSSPPNRVNTANTSPMTVWGEQPLRRSPRLLKLPASESMTAPQPTRRLKRPQIQQPRAKSFHRIQTLLEGESDISNLEIRNESTIINAILKEGVNDTSAAMSIDKPRNSLSIEMKPFSDYGSDDNSSPRFMGEDDVISALSSPIRLKRKLSDSDHESSLSATKRRLHNGKPILPSKEELQQQGIRKLVKPPTRSRLGSISSSIAAEDLPPIVDASPSADPKASSTDDVSMNYGWRSSVADSDDEFDDL